ncbi:schwannomin-interacting protein 1-like [Acipenser oxyrinchus oxyrinchus]|uniref:Schwannomin-interacting protein 1-like n=1 Tax=Acipenser oxyrinchus oxyrinchus TaxID=40147 RepID=A0AAD8CE86_ACIOX|nr:schwannomin-interacting protein 1-like [Acipenser oxyrinchus oxyrinchus]
MDGRTDRQSDRREAGHPCSLRAGLRGMEGDKEGKEREGEEKECDEAELSSDQAESRTAPSHSPLGSSLEDLAMPIMHWEALGRHIEELERQEEQRERERGRRREEKREGEEREKGRRGPQPGEMRREPARLTHRQSVKAQWEEEEEEGGDEEITRHVSELTSRLQSRMNLQLCFINNSESEEEEEEEEERRGKERGRENPAGCTGGRVPALEAPPLAPVARGNLVERQRKVETEARRALARVRERLEKRPEQRRSQNQGLAHTPDGRRLQSADLHTLTIKQLDTLRKRLSQAVQDLSSELVGSLLSRDQLKTEQDAILLEVEDLTAFAENEQTHRQEGNKGEEEGGVRQGAERGRTAQVPRDQT